VPTFQLLSHSALPVHLWTPISQRIDCLWQPVANRLPCSAGAQLPQPVAIQGPLREYWFKGFTVEGSCTLPISPSWLLVEGLGGLQLLLHSSSARALSPQMQQVSSAVLIKLPFSFQDHHPSGGCHWPCHLFFLTITGSFLMPIVSFYFSSDISRDEKSHSAATCLHAIQSISRDADSLLQCCICCPSCTAVLWCKRLTHFKQMHSSHFNDQSNCKRLYPIGTPKSSS